MTKHLKINYSDFDTIKSYLEESIENVKVAYKHRNYILGNEEIKDLDQWLLDKLDYSFEYRYNVACNLDTQELINRFEKKYISLPLYLYDHSGIALNTSGFSCRWDSGQIGFIYMTKENAKKEYGKRYTKKALAYLEDIICTLDNIAQGNQYEFEILDENNESLDRCEGFIGTQHELIKSKFYGELNEFTEEQIEEAFENIT